VVLLKRRLDVRSEGGTLIQVGVFGKRPEEPEEAMDIANTIAEELRAFRLEQHESSADVLQMYLRFTRPDILLGLAVGFVLGLLAGALVLWRGKPSNGSGSGELPMLSWRSAKFSLAIAVFGVLIVLGAIANFNS
jgi:hypothetical protein